MVEGGAGWASGSVVVGVEGSDETGVCPFAGAAGCDLIAAASAGIETGVTGRVSVCTVAGSSRSFR